MARRATSFLFVVDSRSDDERKPLSNPAASQLRHELRRNKVHRMADYLALEGMSTSVFKATLKKKDPSVTVLVGAKTFNRFRPRITLSHYMGKPFYLYGHLAFGIWHPAAVKDAKKGKRKMRSKFTDAVQMVVRAGLRDAVSWPETCAEKGCDYLLDHLDEGGVGWCRFHFVGPEVVEQSQQEALQLTA